MLWFIFFPLVFFIGVTWLDLHDGETPGMSCVWGVVWAVLSLIPALAISAVLGASFPHEERVVGQLEIVSLADATHTNGEFYLFGGYIESEPVYRYYYESDGGFRMGWKPVESSLIVETETEKPHYERIKEVRDTTWFSLSSSQNSRFIFYVPPGTVTNDFNLDLEG